MWSGCGIRMRKASLCRNHQSPSDIVTDRFRSQVLRYTVVLFQVCKSFKVLIVLSLRSNTHKTVRSSAWDPIPCCTTLCYQPELQYHLWSPNEQPSTSDHCWCYHLGFWVAWRHELRGIYRRFPSCCPVDNHVDISHRLQCNIRWVG